MKARDLKCEICGKGMFEKTPLYRNGPIGEIVPWRCIEHVDEQYRPDKDIRALCDIIAGNAPAVQQRKGKTVRSHLTCKQGSFCSWEDSFCKKCGDFDPRTASPVA